MSARRFEFPKVTEIRVTRGTPQAQSPGVAAQRDLVTASLLFCPYGRESRASGEGRSA